MRSFLTGQLTGKKILFSRNPNPPQRAELSRFAALWYKSGMVHGSPLILSIGNEVLDGRTPNSNAQYFGERLRNEGLTVDRVVTVSDELDEIAVALSECEKISHVIVTGGLGPTNDDRTTKAVGMAFSLPLKLDKTALAQVRRAYGARRLPVTPARRKLAFLPKGARILRNPMGTAPGFRLKIKGTEFFFLPGVPTECRPMFDTQILPQLKQNANRRLLQRHFWRTFGRGESHVYQRIESVVRALEKKYPKTFQFGVHISFPCIDLTLESWKVPGVKSPSIAEIRKAKKKIDQAVGDITFTNERETMAEAVLKLLKKYRSTLATAESCTGGLVGKSLTDISGSSEVYLGGVVSYANSAKETFLKVRRATLAKYGAVSRETVEEMAAGVREVLGADYGVAISGVSGPGGGTKDKPVGTTYVAVSSKKGTKFVHQVILASRGSRDQNRVIAMHLALDALRTQILAERRGARN